MVDRVPVKSIISDTKPRGTVQQLATLAASIAESGLLNPITVTPDRRLIAGRRRLAAVRLLTWTDVPVHVVDNLTDLEAELRAERAENVERLDMTPEETFRLGQLIEEEVRIKALARRSEQGGDKFGHSTSSDLGGSGATSKKSRETPTMVGETLGMGGTKYRALRSIGQALDSDDPGTAQAARDAMDRVNAGAGAQREAASFRDPVGTNQTKGTDPWLKRWQGLAIDAHGMARAIPEMQLPTDMTEAARWVDDLRRLRTAITQTIKRLEESVPR